MQVREMSSMKKWDAIEESEKDVSGRAERLFDDPPASLQHEVEITRSGRGESGLARA